MLPVYVLANGRMFREVFNAIVSIIHSASFASAFTMSMVFAVLGGVLYYIKAKDIFYLAKWFGGYFLVVPQITLAVPRVLGL